MSKGSDVNLAAMSMFDRALAEARKELSGAKANQELVLETALLWLCRKMSEEALIETSVSVTQRDTET